MKNYYYLIEFQYLGFRYHGWQKQPELKTVQGMVEKTVNYVLGYNTFKTLSASRTDAMVSANQSAFELFLREPIDADRMLEDLNINLPPDIRALSIQEVDQKFNIIQHAKEKEYLYLFSFGQKNHPFCAPFMTYVSDNLNINLMKEGAKIFEGTHDFRRYCYKPTEFTKYNRSILVSEIVPNDLYTASFFPSESFIYRVKGSGFMRHQIRIMMETLFRLGKGELSLEEIRESLTGSTSELMNGVAPSSGLMLHGVHFDKD
ncbi:tRNA pseudouridine(38-40) synthase TruA [Reichenbachiella sp. MALMAid0571]|uniref:tRNA pseudouridine synthase A n=1 Tax=Reichenbachiella sp. MALMAid0571 TaxID=3143939 RepID=UPI0032DF1BCB